MLNYLEYSIVERNDFTGSFMSEMGLMALLNGINTGFNNMSSSLPNEIFNAQDMEYICVDNNTHTGSLPSEIGKLTLLKGLLTG